MRESVSSAIDTCELEQDGMVVLRDLLDYDDLCDFEAAISAFCQSQSAKLKPAETKDPFINVFARGGYYAIRVYKLLERLFVLHRMSLRVAERLRSGGFFDWAGIKVPLVWPDVRADLPQQTGIVLPQQYGASVPVHQDYGSTKCHTAWALWVPLRPANVERGSMLVYKSTHKRGPVAHNLEDPLRPYIEPHHYAGLDPIVFDLPAGDGVLMSPLVFHASVPNRSPWVKFTLLIQIQDLATMTDPDDTGDRLAIFEQTLAAKDRARVEA